MSDSPIVKFKGKVIRCTYNSENFKVYALDVNKKDYPNIKRNEKYDNVTLSGDLPSLVTGVEYEITGTEVQNKYGVSYTARNVRRDTPTSQEDVYLFLSEILTANQAKTLFEHYPDIIDRVKEGRINDVDLSKLKGIKEHTFNVIVKKIAENFCLSDLVVEFKGILSLSMIKKIYDKYSSVDLLKKKLKKNPYKCLCALAGVGFKKADILLLEMERLSKELVSKGQAPIVDFDYDLKTSKERCLSCAIFLLEENENNGHTKMNIVDLRAACIRLIPECVGHFTDIIKDGYMYYNKDTMDVAIKSTFYKEKYIAETVLSVVESRDPHNIWNYDIEKYRVIGDSELSDEQMNVLQNVCDYGISILNGAAGTGKSYSTQAILAMTYDNEKSVTLLSPTGKASKVLKDYTKHEAATIHRGLGYNPNGTWTFNKEHKLHTDLIIVDEFSMVDIFLFERLIDAIDFQYTKLLLIGDNAQLTSVQCGNLLHDFMVSNIVPTTTLSKVFRYNEGGLMKVATDVRFCKPYLDATMRRQATVFGDNKDYMFIDSSSDHLIPSVVALYQKLLNSGYNIEDIQILSAKNIGNYGSVAINKAIQKVANPNYGKGHVFKIGETEYYEGDIVIQTVNNYNAPIDGDHWTEEDERFFSLKGEPPTAFVANGESGIVDVIGSSFMVINFDGIYVRYTKADMNGVSLGYSISIHKSQGSGIKVVIMLTPQDHTFMLNSNLIYVGLTRMKEKCYHIGSLSAINKAVQKKANLERHTFMQELLKGMGENED